MTEQLPGRLGDDEFAWVSSHVPIACVDVVPVVRDEAGRVDQVGLIRRASPFGDVWCQVGGRVGYDEPLAEAAERHLSESLGHVTAAIEAEPFFVNEYFAQPRPPYGLDPRKHAVAICFAAVMATDAEVAVVVGGEATDFAWFVTDELPDDLWPGTGRMLDALIAREGWRDEGATYEALVTRESSHNELMWQAPTLAMTAMAFLMTIALGDGTRWGRSLAALLCTTVAVVSVQLMLKHSYHQLLDADSLREIERSRRMRPVHGPPPASPAPGVVGWLQRQRSRTWWAAALAFFGLASVAVFVLAVVGI